VEVQLELLNLELEPPQGIERSEAIENKSAHGEPVEPLERLEQDPFFGKHHRNHTREVEKRE
jgi:hypothetical protein